MNATTGKDSKDQAFTEGNWGGVCRQYLMSINSLREGSLAKIVEKAQEFMKLSRRGAGSDSTGLTELNEYERGELIDISDDEGRGRFVISTLVTNFCPQSNPMCFIAAVVLALPAICPFFCLFLSSCPPLPHSHRCTTSSSSSILV
jgi:hypothetical protein